MKKRSVCGYTERIDDFAFSYSDDNNDFAYELYNGRYTCTSSYEDFDESCFSVRAPMFA